MPADDPGDGPDAPDDGTDGETAAGPGSDADGEPDRDRSADAGDDEAGGRGPDAGRRPERDGSPAEDDDSRHPERDGSPAGDDDGRHPERDDAGRSGDRDGSAGHGRDTAGDDGDESGATGHERGEADDGEGGGSETVAPAAAGDRQASRPSPADDDSDGEHNDFVDFVREVFTSVGTVLLVGALLFGASGVWPPLVAVESGSMEPHMSKGDLVFVAENGRYAPGDAVRGVVPSERGEETGYWSFGDHGNVVVYQPDGRARTPVIHRAVMYVEEGENWVERADPQYLGDSQTCAANVHCPAAHDGFITRGDANPRYDQAGTTEGSTLSDVVKPEWVRGNAKVRLPKLGCIRLELSGIGCEYPLIG